MNLNVNTEVSRRLEDSLRRKTLTREDKKLHYRDRIGTSRR